MSFAKKITFVALFILSQAFFVFADEDSAKPQDQAQQARKQEALFQGEVTSGGINVRSDSTTNSEVICKLNKGEKVDVVSELYNWYKIRLPSSAPAFINKEFLELHDEDTEESSGKAKESKLGTATVTSDNVNIRLRPDMGSPILGRVNKDTEIKAIGETGDWFKIEPPDNTTGWIYKNFVKKVEKKKAKSAKQLEAEKKEPTGTPITVEGTIKPKVFTRQATHKLITKDSKVYLLKADIEKLNPFNSRKARIIGRINDPTKENPVIEVENIEALD